MNVRLRAGLVAGAALSLALTGCGDGGGGADTGTIALLLPESQTARYEAQDRPLFEAKMKELCADCEIIYSNASQDSSKQQQQAEAALTKGADVMVLDAVDSAAAQAIVNKAKQQGVPVVAYDRLAQGPVDYYVSFQNEEVGKLQGKTLLEALGDKAKTGKIVMINGDPTDPNAAQFKAGAHSVLDGQVTIGQEYDTPKWNADNAQREMDQAITKLGRAQIVGVYAANDGTAGGAIAAMKAAGFSPLPPITGQDAELAAVQRVLAGDQYMTVYKAIKPEAAATAILAHALLQDEEPDLSSIAGITEKTLKNGSGNDVKSFLLTPVAVTKANAKTTVQQMISDGFFTKEQICTAQYAAACQAAGIS